MQPSSKKRTKAAAPAEEPVPDSMVQRRKVAAVLFLMLISLLLTSTLLVIGGVLVYRNAAARLWKHTEGILIDAHVEHHPNDKNNLPDMPSVKYTFSAGGKQFVSDKWSPAGYGLDIEGAVARLKRANPLVVYYNPRSPSDSAVVLPAASIGFLPLVLGLGLMFTLVIAIGGGMLFTALHPALAAQPGSPMRRWIITNLRVGFALILSSFTGLYTLIAKTDGGWWQWAIAAAAVCAALTIRRPRRAM